MAILLLVASQFHLVSRLSSGSVFDPEFSRPLIIVFNVLFGAIVLLAVFQIALDVVSSRSLRSREAFPLRRQFCDMPSESWPLAFQRMGSTRRSECHRSTT